MDPSSRRNSPEPEIPFDPSQPFKGVVVCCTSIPPDQRTDLEAKIHQLGGIHKYDLTRDVTHLIVGQYDTPKYHHVAQQRVDIKAMDARWVDAVGQLWMNDAEINFEALEKKWQLLPLETNGPEAGKEERGRLLLCMTGFDDPDQRQRIVDTINNNGGTYTGDLTRQVTHLIVCKPEGKKYKAAKAWGVRTVSLAWLDQTIERGMILRDHYFDPTLPPEEQGQGAWNRASTNMNASVKRSRSISEHGQRKLRKTASLKLSSQRDHLWGDILRNKPSTGSLATPASESTENKNVNEVKDGIEVADSAADLSAPQAPPPDVGIFGGCSFAMSGFEKWKHDVLVEAITSLGGTICNSVEQLAATNSQNRHVIVPQRSRADSHPQIPGAVSSLVSTVTEFFIERCLHNKTLCDPKEHALGRPFPHFPVSGFEELAICTAGFAGIDLLHVEKCITQLGAKYAARLNGATSVLVCRALAETRKEKLKFALEANIPVVSADWLWECVSTGYNVPVQNFLFPKLMQDTNIKPRVRPRQDDKSADLQRKKLEQSIARPGTNVQRTSSRGVALDDTAFTSEKTIPSVGRGLSKRNGTAGGDTPFETARTHQQQHQQQQQMDSFGGGTVPRPLSDLSTSALNKSPSPQKPASKPSAKVAKPHISTSAEDFAAAPPQASGGEEDVREEIRTTEEDGNGVQQEKEGPTEEEIRAELKRKQDEKKAAERAAISSKITSLIEARATASSSSSGILHVGMGGSGGGEEARLQDEEAATGGGNGAAAAAAAAAATAPKLSRRKKGIFGRAVSNVSAASSASLESAAGKATTPVAELDGDGGLLARARSDGVLMMRDRRGHAHADGDDGQQEQPLPSTQIGYQDPEAAQCKAELMRRMLGGEEALPVVKTKVRRRPL
ncbi:BRCT domain-containing protein [Sodiomyces alkalinus F11]|uniref:BRCT domain-containing protein n=1 Tax=Sodiomyces alkalinus (strain CBS 110278 / VKM F-3762 / F11) TaxID=1314773 RepID=A0A3N2PU99_SODAK|nr:BRCT domain-containing protein [Sodiomyces alkalinus F11]ROT38075.1 BRCT domain-containing protein [Sodiomyces alkalinus F11]